MRVLVILGLGLANAVLAGGAAPAWAQGAEPSAGQIEKARAHYKKGAALFNIDEHAGALEEFRAAYVLHPDATFLFNIAQCHRKLGSSGEALTYYKRYLRDRPDAPNRAEVERLMTEMEAAVAEEARAAREAAQRPPPPAGEPDPAPRAEPPPGLDLRAPAPAPAPAQTPLYKRWWLWSGVAAVVAIGATTAVLLSRPAKTGAPYQGDLDPGVVKIPASLTLAGAAR